jgi:hypothetical protein
MRPIRNTYPSVGMYAMALQEYCESLESALHAFRHQAEADIERARVEERENCAKVCEAVRLDWRNTSKAGFMGADDCITAIRALPPTEQGVKG